MTPYIAVPTPTSEDHVYNRRSWPAYAEAIRQSGGHPVEVALTATPAQVAEIMRNCHGIVLPGSPADVDPTRYGQAAVPECAPADPAREIVDTLLLEDAFKHDKPIFGICFGAQMLNVWRGGTLVQNLSILPVNHEAGRAVAIAHTVAVDPASVLGMLLSRTPADEARVVDGIIRLPVNSSHHQAVGIAGSGLRVTARCPQDAVAEAIESDLGGFVLGVQWHPERSFAESAFSRLLFESFVVEASRFATALREDLVPLS